MKYCQLHNVKAVIIMAHAFLIKILIYAGIVKTQIRLQLMINAYKVIINMIIIVLLKKIEIK